MNKKLLYVLPLLGIVGILQLLYFWISSEAECNVVVYVFVTSMTTIHMIISYLLWFYKGTRRAMPTILVGTIIAVVLVLVSGGMLLTMATSRTAIFALSVISILYFVIVLTFVFSAENNECINIHYEDIADNEKTASDSNSVVSEMRIESQNSGTFNEVRVSGLVPPPLPIRR